jgi:hypothetical protein
MATKTKKSFNVAEIGPTQAWVEFKEATDNLSEANRIKKAVREHYLPMVSKAGRALVLFTDEAGLDHGFEVKVSATFQKSEFETRLLKRFGKKLADEIMDEYNESKSGTSTTFGAF